VELEAEYRPAPGWFLYGNYSYNESKITKFKENTALEGKYLPWIPKWGASVGIAYSNPQIITARLNGHYVGVIYDDDLNKKEIGEYFTMNIKLSRKMMKNIEASLDINDLTDKHYQQSTYSISPGRIIMGNLRFTF
jgi:iron complex outermembrane receptor protein